MTKTLPAVGCICLLVSGAVIAQTESGPKAGTKIEPLQVHVTTGDDAGKKRDLGAEAKKKPVVFVFVQADKWDRPMARFLKELDKKISADRNDVIIAAVWLTDDVDKSKDYLPKAQQSIQLEKTLWTVFPGEKSGPKGWDINNDAHMTVVITDAGKIGHSAGYMSVNETDVRGVMQKLPKKK